MQVGSHGRVGVNAARTVMVENKLVPEFALLMSVMVAPGKGDRVTCMSATVCNNSSYKREGGC